MWDLTRVAELGGRVAAASEVSTVIDLLVEAPRSLGARAVAVFFASTSDRGRDGTEWELARAFGFSPELLVTRFPRPGALASTCAESARSGEPRWSTTGAVSLAVLPMHARGLPVGALAFELDRTRVADDQARTLWTMFTQQVAHALAALRADERSARLREEFLSVAGHELKTPLAALLLQLQAGHRLAIRAGEPASRITERLSRAVGSAERLARLVDEVLEGTRMAAEPLQVRLKLEQVDLGVVVRDTVERFRQGAAAVGTELHTALGETPVLGLWDRSRLEQITSSLVDNAVKYGRGRPVHVTLAASAEQAILTVRDQGFGIEPEQQARIFERFVRAVPERRYGGLGLGLWVARQSALALGGSVDVQSAPAAGATFIVTLPRSQPDQALLAWGVER